jgi:hypothetical protein
METVVVTTLKRVGVSGIARAAIEAVPSALRVTLAMATAGVSRRRGGSRRVVTQNVSSLLAVAHLPDDLDLNVAPLSRVIEALAVLIYGVKC